MNRTYRAKCWFAGVFAIGVSLGLSASNAEAQWAPDRAYTEGPGIRVGNLELHPGVAVRAGYDTNIFRVKNNPTGAAILAVTPHLHLSTLKAQCLTQGEDAAGAPGQLPAPVAFDLGLAGTFFKMFNDRAPTNVEADTTANLSVLPERSFGFDVGIAYARSTRPFTDASNGSQKNIKYAFDRITPNLTLRTQSRGGVLKASAGYSPSIIRYESNTFQYLDAANHNVPLAASWKFLPYTALLYDGLVGFQRYSDQNPPASGFAAIDLSNSNRFQSRVGINGAVTTRFSLRALVGYGVINNEKRELRDREDAVGEAAATFAWAPGSSAEVGYTRTLDVTPLGGWMQMDRGYAKTSMLFAQAFQLSLDAGAAHVNYGTMLAADGSPLGATGSDRTKRSDVRIDGGVHGEYRATNWLAFMADFTVLANLTKFEYVRATATPFPAQFVTVQAYGGVRFHY